MKVTKYVLSGDSDVNLPIVSVSPTDKFILKNIDGLGPPDVTNNIGKTGYSEGFYQGSQPQPRQLVIRVGLNPDYSSGETVESLREVLYGMLATDGDGCEFQIWNGITKVAIAPGWVTKFEIVPFAKDPEVQITVDCRDAYFIAPESVIVDLSGASHAPLVVNNIGSISTGFQLVVNLTAGMSAFTIFRETITHEMVITYDFHDDDAIVIDTRDGSRDVYLTRSPFLTISLLDNIGANPEWLKFVRGSNNIWFANINFTFASLQYTPQYLGV